MDEDQEGSTAPEGGADKRAPDEAAGGRGADETGSGEEADTGSDEGADEMGPATLSPVAVAWETIEEDVAATAEEYRAAGWDAVELHPGDVTALSGELSDRWGLDVLLPDDEFDDLAALSADHEFDETEVYRGTLDTVVFALLALEDTDAELVVLAPVYVDLGDDPGPGDPRETLQRAVDAGGLPVNLRPLDERSVVSVSIEEPELLLPEPDGDEATDGDEEGGADDASGA